MMKGWRLALGALVFAGGMMTNGLITPDQKTSGIAQAAAQGAYPGYTAPLGLHRSCRQKIRAAYRAPGCTRRCYPRNFYRQRMDYCIRTGGSI